MTFALLLCGPSYLFPDSLIILAVGLSLLGTASVLITVPALVELNSAVKKKYGQEKAEILGNSISSTFAVFQSAGLIIGPFYG